MENWLFFYLYKDDGIFKMHLIDIRNNVVFTVKLSSFFFLFDVTSEDKWNTKNYLKLRGGNRQEEIGVMLLTSRGFRRKIYSWNSTYQGGWTEYNC